MRMVVGLGNPGAVYAGTRHNVGFMAVQRLAGRDARWRKGWWIRGRWARLSAPDGGEVLAVEPWSYMNRSGAVVQALMRRYRVPVEGLVVVYDDTDLELGRLRVRPGGRTGGHRGVASIVEALGTEDFARVRLGIGRPPAGTPMVDFVLSPFEESDAPAVERMNELAAAAIRWIWAEGVESAMNRYNGMK